MSPLILFLLVIIAPVYVETVGYVLVVILTELYSTSPKPNSFSYDLAKRSFELSILVVYCALLLKLFFTKPTRRRENTSLFLCFMLVLSSHFVSFFTAIATRELYTFNVFFAKVRDLVGQSIEYIFQLIPNLRLEVAAIEVIQPPTFITTPSIAQYSLEFIESVVLAPIVEEFALRFCVFRIASKHFGMLPAFLLSSISFALMHKAGNVITHALLFGMVLCSIYILSNYKIWVPILAHFLHNFLVQMDELVMLIKKADFPIGFPTDTETAYQFAIKTGLAVDILSILSTVILVAVYSMKAFSLWRGRSLAEQKAG